MVDWKIKGLYKADAGLVYEEITSIGDEVTPGQIVDYAKDKDTELHKCFEWKDKIAAHKYRLSQAQSIIRNIVYIKDYKDEDENDKQLIVRAIVCKNEHKNTYQTIKSCIEDPESYGRLQASMLKDITIFRQRYEKYSMLKANYSDLFDALDAITV